MIHKTTWWLKWHRRLGLAVVILIFMLTVSGILINHSQSLGWHHEPVYDHWLARLYGIPPSRVHQGFPVGEAWVSELNGTLYLNESELVRCDRAMLGAMQLKGWVAVVCADSMWLFELDGELVEHIRGVPFDARRMGVTHEGDLTNIFVTTAAGLAQFDEISGSWIDQRSVSDINWLQQAPLPEQLADRINSQAPVAGLTRERVLLDLHSGRILGKVGVWIVDAAAVAMLILACSGLFAWFGRYRKRGKRNIT